MKLVCLAALLGRMTRWMWPWAAVYCAQIAISMLVWNLLDPRGGGLALGVPSLLLFVVPTIAWWRARALFAGNAASPA